MWIEISIVLKDCKYLDKHTEIKTCVKLRERNTSEKKLSKSSRGTFWVIGSILINNYKWYLGSIF